MTSDKFDCCLIFVLVAIVGGYSGRQCISAEQNDKGMVIIRAEDISKTVQIVGRFGQPLGKLMTIRGQWIRPGARMKDRSLMFHVSLVNGKETKGIDDLHGLQIRPIFPEYKGRKPTPTESWDWRFDWAGIEPAPTPVEGEKWEMMGVETGRFDSYSDEAWREIGSPVVPKPPFMEGFYSRFEYIAVKVEVKR